MSKSDLQETTFNNFIDASNFASMVDADRSSTKIICRNNKWIVVTACKTLLQTSHRRRNIFLDDDLHYAQHNEIPLEKFYKRLSLDDLVARAVENSETYSHVVGIIRNELKTRYQRLDIDTLRSALQNSRNQSEKLLLRAAIDLKLNRYAEYEKELVSNLKEWEEHLKSLPEAGLEELWKSREAHDIFPDTDEYIMLEYFYKKLKRQSLSKP